MPSNSPQNILVFSNEPAIDDQLRRTVRDFAVDPAARIHVVEPDAHEPMAAIADALTRFPANALIIAADTDLVDHALACFGLPTIDVAAQRVEQLAVAA